jgi:hypothetical protein
MFCLFIAARSVPQPTYMAQLKKSLSLNYPARRSSSNMCANWPVDEAYPHAEYIRLVQDNLNTQTPAALYETFPPA